jgi:hypothetical protein
MLTLAAISLSGELRLFFWDFSATKADFSPAVFSRIQVKATSNWH